MQLLTALHGKLTVEVVNGARVRALIRLPVLQLVCNGELVPGPFPCPVLWDAGPLPAVQLPEAVQGMQLRFLGWGAQVRASVYMVGRLSGCK